MKKLSKDIRTSKDFMRYYINDKGQKVKPYNLELKSNFQAKEDWLGYALLLSIGVLIISTIILLMQQLKL
jgi:hypothetical protein